MHKFSQIIFLIILSVSSYAQVEQERIISGTVSYISSQNVYVKFKSTEGIEIGDTLFVKENEKLIPALTVQHRSSTSCAGSPINEINFEVGDQLFAAIISKKEDVDEALDEIISTDTISIDTKYEQLDPVSQKDIPQISGRISVQSYTNFSNLGRAYDYQRWRYTFRLNADNIAESGFSYSHYINFAYRASDWNRISSNLSGTIRIYDLAVNYDFNESTRLLLGRHINNNISNISSIDGLQFETSLNKWNLAIVVGSRPDFNNNMGLNLKLFQYGGYINRTDIFNNGNMKNTLGYFEQTNNFNTDRRFLYFQHSNSLIENTRLFISSEVDIFKKENGLSKTSFSLTSLYTSVNIRPSNFFSIFLSYDARKNVIYYETFKSFADSVLENETRQGFRTRIIVKPLNNLTLGAHYGYRYRKSDIKPSNNVGGYITYSMIPVFELSSTVNYNRISSSYVEGDIIGISLNKQIILDVSALLGYRFTNYKFRSAINDLKQHTAYLNIYFSILKPLLLNFTYEGIFDEVRTSGRLLINLTYRF